MRIPDLLVERELFAFDPDTVTLVERFVAEMQQAPGWLSGVPATPDQVGELVALTAAEYALMPRFDTLAPILPVSTPIPVPRWAGAMSALKCDCAGIEWCSISFSVLDTTAFSGDIAKLRLLDIPLTEPVDEIGDLARAVDTLEAAHRSSPSELSQRLGESGLLRLQGFLWAVKSSLPTKELEEAVVTARDAFQLDEPSPARATQTA